MERQYKDSGIEWIGRIPEGWKMLPLAIFFAENSKPNSDLGSVNALQFKYGEIIQKPSNGKDLSEKDCELLEKYTVVAPDDIVVNGLNLNYDLKSLRIAKVRERGIITSAYIVLRPRNGANASYYNYYLKALDFQKIFHGMGVGIRLTLSYNELRPMLLPVPPTVEQQRIASYLDMKCGEIDALIALQEKMIAQLTEYKQAVITEAVTKGLDPNAKLVPSGIEWIGEVPEGWRIMPIKYLKSSEKNAFVDGPFGSSLKSEHFIVGGDVLVIESGFITTGKFIFKEFKTISNQHFETIRRSECKAHDVIIAKIGANYGMAGELPELGKLAVVSGNSLKITLDNNKIINSIFVYLMMTSKHNHGFIDLVQENAQPALSLSGLNKFKLPIPSLPEQHRIATYLDTKCSEIDSLVALKRQKIESLNAYKKSVIYEAVTGKTIIE